MRKCEYVSMYVCLCYGWAKPVGTKKSKRQPSSSSSTTPPPCMRRPPGVFAVHRPGRARHKRARGPGRAPRRGQPHAARAQEPEPYPGGGPCGQRRRRRRRPRHGCGRGGGVGRDAARLSPPPYPRHQLTQPSPQKQPTQQPTNRPTHQLSYRLPTNPTPRCRRPQRLSKQSKEERLTPPLFSTRRQQPTQPNPTPPPGPLDCIPPAKTKKDWRLVTSVARCLYAYM